MQAFEDAVVYLKLRQVLRDAAAAKGMTSKDARDVFKNEDAELKALDEAGLGLPSK